jgi:hypothetical protein
MRFTPRWRKAILTLHVVTAVGWLGSDMVLLTLGVAGLSGAVGGDVAYPAMSLVGTVLFVPLSFLVWVVGVVNALGTPWGLLRWWWVAVKLVIVTVMLFLVTFLLYPGLVDAGELGPALPHRDRINLVIAPSVSSTLLIVATVLSTYKPWGRRRTGERQPSLRSAVDDSASRHPVRE